MTYVAILRSAAAPERDLVRLERQTAARIARACPTAKRIASGGTSGRLECLDLFETPDDATAAELMTIARAPGLTEPVLCREIPWELFTPDLE